MTLIEITACIRPVFDVLVKARLSDTEWMLYAEALQDLHPNDLDDAMRDLLKTHAFRAMPLPADVRTRAEVARKARLSAAVLPAVQHINADPSDGEWRTHEIKGLGSIRMHVLPDDHPALTRYACLACKDTGWQDLELNDGKQPTYRRCRCVPRNPVLAEQRAHRSARQRTT